MIQLAIDVVASGLASDRKWTTPFASSRKPENWQFQAVFSALYVELYRAASRVTVEATPGVSQEAVAPPSRSARWTFGRGPPIPGAERRRQ